LNSLRNHHFDNGSDGDDYGDVDVDWDECDFYEVVWSSMLARADLSLL